MKAHLRTTLILASLATTLPAQNTTDDARGALERALLIEQQEGDLATAQKAYEALLRDQQAKPVHDNAALHLGSLLWRLGKRDAARPMLERAAQAGGELAQRAEQVLQSDSVAMQGQQERIERARALIARMDELTARPRKADGKWDPKTTKKIRDLSGELQNLGKAAVLSLIHI